MRKKATAEAATVSAAVKVDKKPMRFRVVAGTHYDGNKAYCTGDVIESYVQLDQKFKNKFVQVFDEEENAKPLPEKRQNGFRTIRRGGNRFDVINEKSGEVINERFLSLDEAKELERAADVPFAKMEPRLKELLSVEIRAKNGIVKTA